MKKIVVLHTSMVSFNDFNQLFTEIIPEAEITNIVDEDLLATLNNNGTITHSIIQRICNYIIFAEVNGADMVFSQCSSTREAIECARKMVEIPVVMVDDGMAEKAVTMGQKIGVVATAVATLNPTGKVLSEMLTLLPDIRDTKVPVLTSPRLGIEKARSILGLS